jgi:hypothetical protein
MLRDLKNLQLKALTFQLLESLGVEGVKGRSPATAAAGAGHVNVLEYLYGKIGVSGLAKPDNNYHSAAGNAAAYASVEALECLDRFGVDVLAKEKSGNSASEFVKNADPHRNPELFACKAFLMTVQLRQEAAAIAVANAVETKPAEPAGGVTQPDLTKVI